MVRVVVVIEFKVEVMLAELLLVLEALLLV